MITQASGAPELMMMCLFHYFQNVAFALLRGLLDCNCSDVWYSGTILSKNRSKGKSGVFLVFFPDLDEDFEVKFDSETWILLDYSF
jgi:hypothetical protein